MPNPTEVGSLYTCCRCQQTMELAKFFYHSNSSLYNGTRRMPVCKNCLTDIVEDYIFKYGDRKEAMKRMCMAFDVYYNDDALDPVVDDDNFIGQYFKRLNMTQCKGKTFDNSLDEGIKFAGMKFDLKSRKAREKMEAEEKAASIMQDDIKKWGAGFDPEDYDEMNRHYALLKSANPRADGNQENYIMDCCRIKMHQLKASREGRLEDFQKMTELYTKNYKAGNLKSAGDSAIAEDFVFGVTVETIEQTTPAEYYKGKELYRDFDNIGSYFERMIVRPLKNIILGTREKDYEFYVRDEDEDGDDDE